MTTIAAMEVTRVNIVMLCTRPAHHKNSPVKTSNAFDPNIVVMARTIVVTDLMRWAVRKKRIAHVPQVNSRAPMGNALIIIWYATKYLIARTIQTNQRIVMWTNVPKWSSINAAINVWIH